MRLRTPSRAGVGRDGGLGAGGTLAGFLVGLIKAQTGSHTTGFIVLGALVFLGGISLTVYGSLTRARLHQLGCVTVS
jgi:MFS-type transporter involved in bile tolerance (Atg22 family)